MRARRVESAEVDSTRSIRAIADHTWHLASMLRSDCGIAHDTRALSPGPYAPAGPSSEWTSNNGVGAATLLLLQANPVVWVIPGSLVPWAPRDLRLDTRARCEAVDRVQDSVPYGQSRRIDVRMGLDAVVGALTNLGQLPERGISSTAIFGGFSIPTGDRRLDQGRSCARAGVRCLP